MSVEVIAIGWALRYRCQRVVKSNVRSETMMSIEIECDADERRSESAIFFFAAGFGWDETRGIL
jgi:hypothetical protein